MGRTAIIISALIALLHPVPSADALVDDSGAAVVVHGATVGQQASIDWAVGRFAEAGLPLPRLVVYIHSSEEGCDGHQGLYTRGRAADRIDLCTDNEFILLHELAHAWDRHFLTDADRSRFLAARGLAEWAGHDVEYRERGEEAAANLVAGYLVRSELSEAEARARSAALEDFESLTGVRSPRLTP